MTFVVLLTLYDTVLYMRAATCGGHELGCSDDVTGCGTGEPNDYHGSRLSLAVSAGQTYFLFVDGSNGGPGPFRLTVAAPTPPSDTLERRHPDD